MLLYCCFTAALLLLYCCFTAALLLIDCCLTAAVLLLSLLAGGRVGRDLGALSLLTYLPVLLYCCFTAALLLLYFCFTRRLTSLPPDFGALSALTYLSVAHNHLSCVPAVLGRFFLFIYLCLIFL